MKQNKGFLLIQEVVILGLCTILLCTALKQYYDCLNLEENSREIMDTHLFLERAMYGLEDNHLVDITYKELNGYIVMEVRRSDGKAGVSAQAIR